MSTRPPLPAARPGLRYGTVDKAIADVRRLRAAGAAACRSTGQWSLGQIAWHVGAPLANFLMPPSPGQETPTPEQAAAKQGFYAMLSRRTQQQLDAPPTMHPPADAGEADVDRLIELLERLKAYPHALVAMGPFGPTSIDEFRSFNLMHVAHHLSLLCPTSTRRSGLRFESPADVIADIEHLRTGYAQAGQWTLAQVCWHLDVTTRRRMMPDAAPVPNTPEQDARKEAFQRVMATGELPAGLPAPDFLQPPPDAGDAAIDGCIDAMRALAAYRGPFAVHRLFGNMSDDDARRNILIHAAHHLSHLNPTN